MGGIHKAERRSKSQPAKQCGFTPAKPSRMFSIRRKVRLARSLLRRRDRQCGSKAAATVAADREGSKIERDVQRSPRSGRPWQTGYPGNWRRPPLSKLDL